MTAGAARSWKATDCPRHLDEERRGRDGFPEHDGIRASVARADFRAAELEPILRRSAPLTEYAWRFRYPGDVEEPSVDEARDALGILRDAFEALTIRLPVEARP